jgi:hypothetical protein
MYICINVEQSSGLFHISVAQIIMNITKVKNLQENKLHLISKLHTNDAQSLKAITYWEVNVKKLITVKIFRVFIWFHDKWKQMLS